MRFFKGFAFFAIFMPSLDIFHPALVVIEFFLSVYGRSYQLDSFRQFGLSNPSSWANEK